MENFKFILISIIVLVLIAFIGYWAFFTIESGSLHVQRDKEQQLEQQNEELKNEIEKLTSELESLKPAQEEIVEIPEEKPTETIVTPSKYQSLIDELQKLIDDNVYMKEKSRGTRVGTIQTFLNIYNNKTKRVDNDYGAGTKTDIIEFQKAEKMTADGEAGPNTFLKMIDWLKAH